jgi:hypothetical protein
MRLGSILGSVIISGLFFGAAVSCSEEEGGGDSGIDETSEGSGGNSPILGTGGDGDTSPGGQGTGEGGDGAGGTTTVPVEEACDFPPELSQCGSTSQTADYRTPNILLVVDKSGSMDDPIGDLSKWEALQLALEDALTEVADDMNLGLILYPYNPGADATCEVPDGEDAVEVAVEPATDAVDSIIGALQGTAPGGGTPTAEALHRAYEYYVDGAGADLQGDKYVLLATDGGPNCNVTNRCDADTCTVNLDGKCESGGNCCEISTGAPLGDRCLDDADVREVIGQLEMRGIPTFVVGIPGTEAYADYLNDFAVAGGRELDGDTKYYAVSADQGVEGLTQTFADISTQLVRDCDIELDAAPPQAELVNVAIDCEPVTQDDNSGWDLQLDPPVITLHGDICDFVRNNGAERVDVVLGCPVIR